MRSNLSVAAEGGSQGFVAQVLSPSLHFSPGGADLPSECDQCRAEAVRVRSLQPRTFESIAEDPSDRPRATPGLASQSRTFKFAVGVDGHFGTRKERVIQAEKLFAPKELAPVQHDLLNIIPYREEPSFKSFTELRPDTRAS